MSNDIGGGGGAVCIGVWDMFILRGHTHFCPPCTNHESIPESPPALKSGSVWGGGRNLGDSAPSPVPRLIRLWQCVNEVWGDVFYEGMRN